MTASGIVERIAQGKTTVGDAMLVAFIIRERDRFEAALRQIAAHGDDGAAMLASVVLARDVVLGQTAA
ncbi:hypothetical protein [Hydrogenophilus thermoluteolus]|uniref:Uncharacterized protein n=1 Tax=Hydrogenophilus thermoluteolus TaxID=297 RepID=A0A2Z6DXP0_HYDTE|nr:hypothetical protein [Hydrogenophilus thermoluteolus]MBW7656228.1 hypothetical protein [Hydrogenophilus thermoluteolus]BBD77217.1 hypothetical protein HPTL_0950 [Hydrogenophilus thermoluteolus]